MEEQFSYRDKNPITEVARFFKNIDYDKIINNAELGLDYIKKQVAKGSKETTRMMLELYFVTSVVSAQIDPENKIKCDIDLINNSISYENNSQNPIWKYASKFLFWVENVFQTVFFFA